ncbi:DUF3841 domain-containing protein [Clostridium oceanicum]|uniref:DUF3841 domain-containing protein n=1 Tax=Clostridium oceanicum TaxID=1543 RepID=A0ABP3UQ97_9CLOT
MENKNEKVTLWTCQRNIVLNTIKEKGIYHVKKEFIEKKYREVAKIFLEPYGWFINKAEKILPKPKGAEYPIWLSEDPKYVGCYEDSVILKIEVDSDKVILFDREKWNRILNLSYVPKDNKDLEEYKNKLKEQGIYDETEVYMKNFYPFLKSKVKKSWDRLFDDKIVLSQSRQAALWEIQKDWVVEVINPR